MRGEKDQGHRNQGAFPQDETRVGLIEVPGRLRNGFKVSCLRLNE